MRERSRALLSRLGIAVSSSGYVQMGVGSETPPDEGTWGHTSRDREIELAERRRLERLANPREPKKRVR